MQTSNETTNPTGSAAIGELTPGRLGENTGALPTGVTSGSSSGTTPKGNNSTPQDTHIAPGTTNSGAGIHSDRTSGTSTAVPAGAAAGTGAGLTAAQPHSHTHSGTNVKGSHSGNNGTGSHSETNGETNGTGSNMGPGIPAGTPATATTALATGASLNGHNPATGTTVTGSGPDGPKDLSRASGISGQEACGNHLVPGMEDIGTGYSGPHTKRGDISAPTGSLPAGTVEKGATNQAIPRPSAKDYFKMSNAGLPSAPQALAHRPVHQDPISEADHVAPSHGGHSGNPGNMTSSTPSQREEGVNPYATGAHGDHLVQGLHHDGIGYAGATTARGDNTAPTGSLPPGTIEAGAQNQAIPRPSAKDQFLINNSGTPSNPIALAKRAFKDGLGIGKAPSDAK